MNSKRIQDIVYLRLCVGYLGEANQKSWWQSSFFSQSSIQFLAPVFGKTSTLAQYHGVKESAAIVHDERIGIGSSIHHLFRLPEMLEQDIHRFILDGSQELDLKELTASQESAEQYLLEFAKQNDTGSVEGPVNVGEESSINGNAIWKRVAGLYVQAMQNNVKVFPYFS